MCLLNTVVVKQQIITIYKEILSEPHGAPSHLFPSKISFF